MATVSVFDVAAYILSSKQELTAMKLQKLVYYSQAWSLVWDEEPLFSEQIQAWINGPVVPELYKAHARQFKVYPTTFEQGDSLKLNEGQQETIDAVLDYYGDKSSQWLSDLTHIENPWKDARMNLAPDKRGQEEITHAALVEYYSSLPKK